MEIRPLGDDPELTNEDDLLLGRLMRSVGPLPASEVRKRRVLAAMRARTAISQRRRPALRAAMAAAILLLVGGIAGATVGRAAWDRLVAARQPAAASPANGPARISSPLAPDATPVAASPALPPAAPETAPDSVTDSASADDHAIQQRVRRASRLDEAARSYAQPRPTPISPVATDDEDAPTHLVVAAKRALYEGNAARARVLLDDYLSHYPDGLLVEGALPLAIQAAAQLDDPEAATLARRYLARYPMGQSAEMAREAIKRYSSPTAQ